MNEIDMRVIEHVVGDPEAPLRITRRPIPAVGPDDVLIRVRAAGVNHAELAQRAGRYPLQPGMNDVLGLEVAGTVHSVGERVESLVAGDRVCALLTGGGYAEFACAPASQVLRIPPGIDFAQAAAIPEAFATVWLNVFEKAALQPGEKLLVHGGSSGVGIAAIQLASALGATVYCTAGSEVKCAACIREGAAVAVNYKIADFLEVVGAQGKVDVILDMVGGDYFAKNLSLLSHGGRIVYIASLGGRKVELDLVHLMRKRISLFGSVLRPLSAREKGRILRGLSANLWPLLAQRRIEPHIHERFAFEEAERAHSLMRAHAHIGKLVLEL